MKSNLSDLLSKWLRYGFEQPLFDLYPDFARFLLEGTLASQMKITGDKPFIINDEPAILCESKPLTYSELIKNYSYTTCSLTGEKVLIHSETKQIWTYLGGVGLAPYNPYKNFFKLPIKRYSSDDVEALKVCAALFGREGSHILQIVSCPTSPEARLSRHVYLRLVTAEGELFSFGFNYKKPFSLPYMNHVGLLRSPDIWEYHNRCPKTVTSLLITDEEKKRLENYIESHFGGDEPPVFNLLAQNCALFVKEAVFTCCGIRLPTKSVLLTRTFDQISARWQRLIKRLFPNHSNFFKPFLKTVQELVQSSVEISLSVLLSLVGLTMGAALGIKGRRLTKGEAHLKPPAKNIDWWLELDAKEIHFPLIVEKWQKAQPSTQLCENELMRVS